MNRRPRAIRSTIVFVGFSICLLAVIGLSITLKTHSQQPKVISRVSKDDFRRSVEASPDLPLRVAGNEKCPFRIIQANVKEISGADFSKLTSRVTDRTVVASVPEVRLINTSGQTITGFVLVIRDPQSRASRGFVQQKVSIRPGENYLVKRDHFVTPEKQTVAQADEPIRRVLSQPTLESEKYWLDLVATPSEMFVTVGQVTFSNGETWMIQEGGEVK